MFSLSGNLRMFEEIRKELEKLKNQSSKKDLNVFFFGIEDTKKLKNVYFTPKGVLRKKTEISIRLYRLYESEDKDESKS